MFGIQAIQIHKIQFQVSLLVLSFTLSFEICYEFWVSSFALSLSFTLSFEFCFEFWVPSLNFWVSLWVLGFKFLSFILSLEFLVLLQVLSFSLSFEFHFEFQVCSFTLSFKFWFEFWVSLWDSLCSNLWFTGVFAKQNFSL